MGDAIEVRVPQETVNDDQVLLQRWLVNDGDQVAEGQTLAEVETSKSVFEITSPAGGVICLRAQQDQEVNIGAILCVIQSNGASLSETPAPANLPHSGNTVPGNPAPAVPFRNPSGGNGSRWNQSPADVNRNVDRASPRHAPQTTRISQRAMERLRELGRSPEELVNRGLVRLQDVDSIVQNSVRKEQRGAADRTPGSPAALHDTDLQDACRPELWKSTPGVPYTAQPLARSRRLEAKILSWSSREAIRSRVSVMVPTIGRDVLRTVDETWPERLSAWLISATAELLHEFPTLNACCIGQEIRLYSQIHIGMAVDAGRGLKVVVFPDANQKSPEEILRRKNELVLRYLENALQPADVSGATLTITDLSGAGVPDFDPLISEGQAAILGIGAEVDAAGGRKSYSLILAFDHRLAEGRLAAAFLNRLKERLLDFERQFISEQEDPRLLAGPSCSRCGMTAAEAAHRHHFLTATVAADWTTRLLCTVCLEGR